MADRGFFGRRNQQCDSGSCSDGQISGGQILYDSYRQQGDCNGGRGTCVPRGNDCGNRQIQYNSGQIYDSPQDKQAKVQELITLRNAWLYEAQGNLKTENIGASKVSRDGKGLVRHVEYGPDSDVKARTILAYDQNQQPMKMMVDSKQHGFKEWTRVSANPPVWQDQDKVRFNGSMNMEHKSGVFSYQAAGQRDIYTYGPSGRPNDPADRAAMANGGQKDTTRPDERPVVNPPKNSGDVKQPTGDPKQPAGDVIPPARDTARDGGSDKPVDPNKAAYDKAIKEQYGKAEIVDKTTYKDNVLGSALDKLPMVVTFGRSSDPETAKMLANIKAVQDKCVKDGKPMAAFMFVDLDKVPVQGDFRTDIGGYAKNHIGKDFGTPLTLICNTEQGPGRTPVIPNKPMFHEKGAGDVDRMTTAITEAYATQQGRDIKVPGYDRPKPVDKPVEPPKPEVVAPKTPEVTPKQVMEAAITLDVGKLEASLSAANNNKMEKALADLASPTGTPETLKDRAAAYDQAVAERTKVYMDAISEADKLNNPELSARVRVAMGLATCKWGQQQMDVSATAPASIKDGLNSAGFENYKRGTEWFLAGGLKFPGMYERPGIQKAIAESGLPFSTALGILKNGKEKGPEWFLPEAKDRADENLKRERFRQSIETLLPETFKSSPELWPKRPKATSVPGKAEPLAPLDPLRRTTTATV